MMAENELPIQITVEVNKAEIERQVGVAFSAIKDTAKKAGRDIGDSMAKAMRAEKQLDVDALFSTGFDIVARKRIQQTREAQDYFAKTRTLESQWRIQQTRDTQVHFDAVREIERKTRIQQTRDTQDYFAKLNEARQKQQLLERRDMDEQRLRWSAEKQSTSRGVGDSNLMSAMMSGGSDATRRMGQLITQAQLMNKELDRQNGFWYGVSQRMEKVALLTTQITRAFFGLTAITATVGLPAIISTKYLSTIEDAKLGIAGTLQAISEASGASNDWTSSMQMSDQVINQLNNSAVKYNISLEEISDTFRGIVGVGMAAGMTLKEVGKIATIGTMAVKSLNLSRQQTLQEIRDLAQPGGIQSASSTLATALNITNEMTKKWKEAGTLFENLEKRMAGYTMAAIERQNTLSGSFDILQMKLQRLFADPKGFEVFKNVIKDISNTIGEINYETGEIKFNPELVSMMKSYWEQLSAVAKTIGVIAETTIKILPKLWEVATVFGVWYTSAKVIPIILTGMGAISAAVAALPALFGSASAAMMTLGVTASAVGSRLTAMSAGAAGGLIGLGLFGTYLLADYLGVIDQVFGSAENRSKSFRDKIRAYDVEQLQYRKMRLQGSIEAIEQEQTSSSIPRRYDVDGTKLFGGEALKQLRSNLRETEFQIKKTIDANEKLAANSIIQQGNLAEAKSKELEASKNDVVKRAAEIEQANRRLGETLSGIGAYIQTKGIAENSKEYEDQQKRMVDATKRYNEEIVRANKIGSKDSQRAEKERIKGIEQDFKREQQILDAQYSLKEKQIDQAVKYGLAEDAANIIRKSSVEEQLQATMALQDSYIKMLQSLTGLDAAQKIHRDNKLREIQDARELIEVRQRENQVLDEQRAIMKNLAAERALGTSIREAGQDAAKMVREMDAEQKKKYTIVDPITFAGGEAEAKYRESQKSSLNEYTNSINVAQGAIESAELSWKAGITTTEQFLKVTLLQSEAINKATEAYNKQQAAIDAGSGVVRRKAEEDAKYNESFKGGAEQAFNEYTKGALTAADMTRQAFGNTFKAMEDGLVEFVKTGKLSFGSFVNTVIDGLIRMAAKAAVTNLGQMAGLGSTSAGAGIGGFMGGIGSLVSSFFANGAAFDGIKKYAKGAAFGAMVATSPIAAYASGGIPSLDKYTNSVVSSPTLFKFGQGSTGLMGEKPGSPGEAIMPLARLSDGDLGIKVSGSQSGESNVVISVQVNIEAGGNSDVQTNAQGVGKGMGDLIGAKVRDVILVEQRPGGMLNRSR